MSKKKIIVLIYFVILIATFLFFYLLNGISEAVSFTIIVASSILLIILVAYSIAIRDYKKNFNFYMAKSKLGKANLFLEAFLDPIGFILHIGAMKETKKEHNKEIKEL